MGNAETKEEQVDHPVVKSYVRDPDISFAATKMQLEIAQSFVDVLIETGIKVLTPVVVCSDESFIIQLCPFDLFRKGNDACFVFALDQRDAGPQFGATAHAISRILSIQRYMVQHILRLSDGCCYFVIALNNTFPIWYNKRIKHLEDLVEHQQGQIVELSNKLNEAIDRINDIWYHEAMPGGQLQLKKAKEGFFGNE